MSISVATWNVGEGLGHTDRSPEIVEAVKRLDSDVVMLEDAYWSGNTLHPEVNSDEAVEEAKAIFAQEGYEHSSVEYDNYPGQWAGRHIVALSRVGGSFDSVPFYSDTIGGTSYAARLTVADPEVPDQPFKITGAHFDDQSEQARLEQAEDLAINLDILWQPTVLMGTLYSMNNRLRSVKLLGSAPMRKLVERSGLQEARNPYEERRGRKSNFSRIVEMAQGHALDMLFESHLRDVDAEVQATFYAKQRFPHLKLDVIMANEHVAARDYRVHSQTNLSQHRAISATISVAE